MSIRIFPVVLKKRLPFSTSIRPTLDELKALSPTYARFFGMQIEVNDKDPVKHVILILLNSEPASNVMVSSPGIRTCQSSRHFWG
jgi:hypothetical protein